jgi:L-fuculose-phosphate aldolase
MTLESRLVNLAATAHKLVELGLLNRLSGSVSLRWLEFCYLSPAGARLDRLSAADFIALNIYGVNTWQLQRASSSYALHLACCRARPDAGTVLCLQPPHCLALGCAGLTLPALTPDVYLALGAEVPLLPYLASATQALADGVGQLIAMHEAVLLQNQGMVLVAPSTDEAFARSLLAEETARIVLLARSATGACSSLTAAQIEELDRLHGRSQPSPA